MHAQILFFITAIRFFYFIFFILDFFFLLVQAKYELFSFNILEKKKDEVIILQCCLYCLVFCVDYTVPM